jgi:hypothetical protein
MQVIARRTLREFWARRPHAEGPIRAWFAIAARAQWTNPAEIKRQFGSTVDFVGDNPAIDAAFPEIDDPAPPREKVSRSATCSIPASWLEDTLGNS